MSKRRASGPAKKGDGGRARGGEAREGRRPRRRAALVLAALAAGLAGLAALLVLGVLGRDAGRGGPLPGAAGRAGGGGGAESAASASGADEAFLVPLSEIPWPRLPEGARGAFAAALGGIEESFALYSEGAIEQADERLLASLSALDRAGALVPELGAYHYRLLESAYGRRDFAALELRARKWLERFPDDFHHALLLAQVYFEAGRYEEALARFQDAARIRPASVEAWRFLAETGFQLGRKDVSIGAVRRTFHLIGFPDGGYREHPAAEKVLRNGAKALHRFLEHELLAAAARAYRESFPANEAAVLQAVMGEGIALFHLGRYAEAEPLLREALRDTTNVEEVRHTLAMTLLKEGRWREAGRAFAALLAGNPHLVRAYYQLGICLSRLGRAEDAGAMFARSRALAASDRENRRALELEELGRRGEAAAARAREHLLAGRFAEAESALREPRLAGDAGVLIALAELLVDVLRARDALAVLEEAARRLGAEHADVTGMRARARFLLGEEAAAITDLGTLCERAPERSDWRLVLGKLLRASGRRAEAIAVLEGLEGKETSREDTFVLGCVLLEDGKPERALERLRKVSSGDKRWDEWDGNAWLARALLEGEAGDARESAAGEAARLLDAVPPGRREGRAWLAARAALLARAGGRGQAAEQAAEHAAAREALAAFAREEERVASLRREAARASWPRSAPLYLELAKAHAARGELTEAVRLARVALAAAPARGSSSLPDAAVPGAAALEATAFEVTALRLLDAWLVHPEDVFSRLHALRRLAALAREDGAVHERLAALEKKWLEL